MRAYGSAGVPEHLRDDAEEVACETMRRVAANVNMLVERLTSADYAFAHLATVRQTPTADDLEAIQRPKRSSAPSP